MAMKRLQELAAKSVQWRVFVLAVLTMTAGWIVLTARGGAQPTQGMAVAASEGFLAPDFTLQLADGSSLTLSDLRGKAVILNFWASWCPPCKAEMPAMQQVYTDLSGEGVEIVGVNTTYQDTESDALQFVMKGGITFPIVFDPDGTVSRIYRVQAMPTTYFIDPQGVIQKITVGGPISEAALRAQAAKLLQEKP